MQRSVCPLLPCPAAHAAPPTAQGSSRWRCSPGSGPQSGRGCTEGEAWQREAWRVEAAPGLPCMGGGVGVARRLKGQRAGDKHAGPPAAASSRQAASVAWLRGRPHGTVDRVAVAQVPGPQAVAKSARDRLPEVLNDGAAPGRAGQGATQAVGPAWREQGVDCQGSSVQYAPGARGAQQGREVVVAGRRLGRPASRVPRVPALPSALHPAPGLPGPPVIQEAGLPKHLAVLHVTV